MLGVIYVRGLGRTDLAGKHQRVSVEPNLEFALFSSQLASGISWKRLGEIAALPMHECQERPRLLVLSRDLERGSRKISGYIRGQGIQAMLVGY